MEEVVVVRVGREGETKRERERDSQSVVVMVVTVDLETVGAQWHSGTAQQYTSTALATTGNTAHSRDTK